MRFKTTILRQRPFFKLAKSSGFFEPGLAIVESPWKLGLIGLVGNGGWYQACSST